MGARGWRLRDARRIVSRFLLEQPDGIQDLGTLQHDGSPDIASVALAINDNGDIVGISFLPDFTTVAFLKPNGAKVVDLNTLILDPPGLLFDARSINSRGQIVGLFMNTAGEFHGYLAILGNADDASSRSTIKALQSDYARKLLRRRPSPRMFLRR